MNETNTSEELLDSFLNGQFEVERIIIIDVIVIVLHVINFLSGFGNLFICVLIPRQPALRTPFNAFLVLLSIGCLVTNLVVSPLELAPRIRWGYVTPETRPSRLACIANVYLRTCSFMTSMVVTVMVSILRLLAIISPMKFRKLDVLTVVIACGAAGGLSFLGAVPSVGIKTDAVLVQLCQWSGSPGDARKDGSWWLYAAIIMVVQFTVIGCYITIGILLRRRSRIITPVIIHQSATHIEIEPVTHPIPPNTLSFAQQLAGQQPQVPTEEIPMQGPECVLDPGDLLSQSPPAMDVVKSTWTSDLNPDGSFDSGMSSMNQGGNITEIPPNMNSAQSSGMTLDVIDATNSNGQSDNPHESDLPISPPKGSKTVTTATILTLRVGIVVSVTILLFLLSPVFISMLETQGVFFLRNNGNLSLYPRRQLVALQTALVSFSSAVQPLIYTITSSVFRSQIKRIFVYMCSFRQ